MKNDIWQLWWRTNGSERIKANIKKGYLSPDVYMEQCKYPGYDIYPPRYLIQEVAERSGKHKVLQILIDIAENKPSQQLFEDALQDAVVHGALKNVKVLLKYTKPTLKHFQAAIGNGRDDHFFMLVKHVQFNLKEHKEWLQEQIKWAENIYYCDTYEEAMWNIKEIRGIRKMKKWIGEL